MPAALILVNSDLGKEAEVVKAIRAINSVTEAHVVYGVYDALVKLDAKTMDQLNEAIMKHVRSIPNLRSTITMIVVEEQ